MSRDLLLRRILDLLPSFPSPTLLARELGFSLTKFNYYWSILKRGGFVEKVGYGVWQLRSNQPLSSVADMPRVVKSDSDSDFPKDIDRSHAYQFTMPLPFSLSSRERLLLFKRLGVVPGSVGVPGLWKGHVFFLGDWRVQFNPRSLSCSLSPQKSFFSDNAADAWTCAVDDWIKFVIHPIERVLGRSFQRNKQYVFRTSRQHHARIKNFLARGYRLRRKKLRVFNKSGTMIYLADYSFRVDEFESVHKDSGVSDDQKMHNMVLSVSETGMDFHKVLGLFETSAKQISSVVSNQEYYAENMRSHVEAVQDLSEGVKKNIAVVENLGRGVDKLSSAVEKKEGEKRLLNLKELQGVIKTLDDANTYSESISALSMKERILLSDWISKKLG